MMRGKRASQRSIWPRLRSHAGKKVQYNAGVHSNRDGREYHAAWIADILYGPRHTTQKTALDLLMAKSANLHEQLDRTEEVKGSSDRAFGLTFAVIGAIIAFWPLLDGAPPRWWLLAAVAALIGVSLATPHILHPLNRIWLRIGLLLHRVVSPVILGIIFFGVLTPFGLAMRMAGKNPLRLRFENSASTYWIAREPPGPAPKSMTRQF